MKIRRFIYTGCLILGVQMAFSQPSAQPWNLRQCIDYAIENNIEIKQQEVQINDSELDLNTSKNSRLPNLSGNISQSIGRAQASPSSGVYGSNWSSNTSAGLSSSTTVYAGSRISNQIKYNELNLKAAIEGLEKAKENLELQVTSYYLDVLFKKELLKVAQNQVELTQKQQERTEILVQQGKVPASQLYDLKAQLASNQVYATSAQNDLSLSLLNLSQLLNLPAPENFDIAEPETGGGFIDKNQATTISSDDIYDIALGVKPHIREAEYQLESSKSNVKVARSALYPTVSFSMGLNTGAYHSLKSGISNDPFFDQLWDNRRESFGLSVNVPIFNRMQTRNQVKSARNNVRYRELQLDNVKLGLYKEIQQAYYNSVASEAKYVSTEAAYKAACESFQYMEERYKIGKATVFEYSESQTKLINSQSEHLQAKYDYVFRAKILDFYRGEPIDIL